MTALPIQPLALPDAAHRWITVAQAAHLAGLTQRAVQLKCQAGIWQSQARANPRGGRPTLLIDRYSGGEALYPRAAQAKSDDDAFAQLSAEQRRAAQSRKQLIADVDAYVRQRLGQTKLRQLVADYLTIRRATDPATPSVATYFRWRETWLSSNGSLLALADGRKAPTVGNLVAEFTPEAWQWFLGLYLTPERRKAKHVYQTLLIEAQHHPDWLIPGYKTLTRWIADKLPADLLAEKREGRKARQDLHDAYLPRDYTRIASNQRWISDHHIFDCFGLDDLPGGDGQPIRLWCTTWMDERSRYVVGYRVSRCPNSIVVMASFCEAVLQHGVPYGIYVDNGKDYRAERFAGGRDWRTYHDPLDSPGDELVHVQSIMEQLGVTPTFARPYNAKGKIIESWHNHWLVDKFARFTNGYWGSTPSQRPEELELALKRPKGTHFCGKTFDQLQPWSQLLEQLDAVFNEYNHSPHSGQGMDGRTPAQVYGACQTLAKRTAQPATLRLLLMERLTRTIGRNGLEIDGYCYGTDEPQIMALQGDQVIVRRDTWRADVVYVYDLQDRFVALAANWGLADAAATHEDLAEINRKVNRVNKLRRAERNAIAIADAPAPLRILELQRQRAAALAQAHPVGELPAANIQPMELRLALPESPVTPHSALSTPGGPLGPIHRGGLSTQHPALSTSDDQDPPRTDAREAADRAPHAREDVWGNFDAV